MNTETLKLDGSADDLPKIRHAVKLLQAGALVAFPTETVYGLGADARNAEAIQALNEVKNRPEGKPYSLLISSIRHAEELAGELPRVAQKLARIYWPGPLTLVVPKRGGGAVGLRIPEHPLTRTLLSQCGFPLATPSANLSGEKETHTAEEVRAALDGKISLILDGGPARQGKASVLVQVEPNRPPIVKRAGLISKEEIIEVSRPCVLFVCTGNTCRSPMAQVIFKKLLKVKGIRKEYELPFNVLSAGTSAAEDHPADPQAVEVMRDIKLNLGAHQSRALTPSLIDQADWIFTMTWAQRESILKLMPACRDRVRLLSPQGEDVPDPASRSIERYRQVRDRIARSLQEALRTIRASV